MDTASKDAALNKELGLDEVYDPIVSRTASSTLGQQTPPMYAEGTTPIPPITLPSSGGSRDSGVRGLASGVATPVTKRDNHLLDRLPPGSPMDVGISRVPGSGRGSGCKTPMSLGSPIMP